MPYLHFSDSGIEEGKWAQIHSALCRITWWHCDLKVAWVPGSLLYCFCWSVYCFSPAHLSLSHPLSSQDYSFQCAVSQVHIPVLDLTVTHPGRTEAASHQCEFKGLTAAQSVDPVLVLQLNYFFLFWESVCLIYPWWTIFSSCHLSRCWSKFWNGY